MAIDERRRLDLYEWLREAAGDERADTLMELLPPVGWAEVATKRDLDALEERVDLRFKALEERMELRVEKVDARFEALEERLLRAIDRGSTRLVMWLVPVLIASIGVAVTLARIA
jgi:hypothetical protein